MAYLAVVGSKAVNGVAAIHSDIIKETIFKVRHWTMHAVPSVPPLRIGRAAPRQAGLEGALGAAAPDRACQTAHLRRCRVQARGWPGGGPGPPHSQGAVGCSQVLPKAMPLHGC